jgi:hypothetical protein
VKNYVPRGRSDEENIFLQSSFGPPYLQERDDGEESKLLLEVDDAHAATSGAMSVQLASTLIQHGAG